jgi:hypothetical protein
VSSFVIDTRRDLQPDPQQVLLTDIRNALRNEPAPADAFIPPTSALWINGLWFASLLITLFSAIMGVLAKAWLVKFIPVTSKHDSDSAYQRWILDERAERWYLEKVIMAIPLLIQLALLLFLLGFGLQSLGDNPKLGGMVLSLVLFGAVIYLVMTFLPLLYLSCPYQTPLSDIFLDIKGLFPHLSTSALLPSKDTKGGHRPQNKGDTNHYKSELSKIWHTKLIKSPKTFMVDEAVAELTRKKLSDDWWKCFVQWETPMISLERLREYTTFGFQDEARRYEILHNHLHALSGFVQYFERLKPDADHTKLGAMLNKFLDPGSPLHRWNFFPEENRALAFSIRTPILLSSKKDFANSEMEEQPWETMVYSMPPDHRRNFTLAACRGLVGDREKLRKVSAFSIVICIAKGMRALKY